MADRPPDSPSIEQMLAALKTVYEKHQQETFWHEEERIYPEVLPKLVSDLEGRYSIVHPIALGSTATVWKLFDTKLNQPRALKLPRPRTSRLASIVRAIRGERDKLVALNHQNIVKIYTAGDLVLSVDKDEYSFPYYVMEYLDGVKDLADFITTSAQTCSALALVEYFRHVLTGLDYLHEQGIVHCDLKPANILIAPGRPAQITDFGYAKHFPRPGNPADLTEFTFTEEYAHPRLRQAIVDSAEKNATRAEIPKDALRKQFDLYALGKSMLEVITKHIEQREVANAGAPPFSPYERQFVSIVAKRLLDGQVDRVVDDDLRSDLIAGLSVPVMDEIKYHTPADALADLEKLLDLYSLEGDVPELNSNIASYVQIPHCRVPKTPRVEAVINHPTLARLAQVSQLGFVSFVYPGASHTRFEHVLGTFAHCCEYVRALWHDRRSPLFQCLITRHDVDVLLASALLHDVGQFPMAHDFTEVSSQFAHEAFGPQLMEEHGTSGMDSLADVVCATWGVRLDELVAVWSANSESGFKARMLKAIISGPLDCDKADYLERDSTHLGVTFGLSLDHERLLRNVTVVSASETGKVRPGKMKVVGLGVVEKALVVAESFVRARQELFTQVYWHHTIRSLKAMLGFAIRNTLLSFDERQKDVFWRAFHDDVLWLSRSPRLKSVCKAQEAQAESFSDADWLGTSPPQELRGVSGLHPSDDDALLLIRAFSQPREKRMIDAIRGRELFKRFYILTHSKDEEAFNQVYGRFYNYRLDENLKGIEDWRQRCEQAIRDAALARLKTVLQGREAADVTLMETKLTTADPLILLDVPVKGVSRNIEADAIWYLPEDSGLGGRPVREGPLGMAPVASHQTPFDKAVGKIRVFVPPDLIDLLLSCIPEHNDITQILIQ